MCGVAGLFAPSRPESVNPDHAIAMANALYHRGPDDVGLWADRAVGVALAHRRLSILDLSPAGHQPMLSACERYVIAFNGEIYNFAQIRNEIEASGAAPAWRGHSDTEILLAAIARWGLRGALERSVGMFAIALYDRERKQLALARDRVGEKPLYYGWLGATLLFGSELKALRAHPGWQGEVSRDSLALLLRHNYIPAPYSIFKNVHKLRPGTILHFRREGDLEEEVYWDARRVAEQGVKNPFRAGAKEAEERLDSTLREAVKLQMVADVPLGAFLSGGIDSSVVVALMQAQSSRPVKSFSIGFQESGYNEAPYAKAVAQHLGTEHTELYVTARQAMNVIPRLPTLYDEPFADSSQIPTFLLSQLTRQHVTVSLSGDAGDELFCGYTRYLVGEALARRLSRMPSFARQAAARTIRALPSSTWSRFFQVFEPVLPRRLRFSNPGDKLHKLAGLLAFQTPVEVYRYLVSHWQEPSEVVLGAREPATVLTGPADWSDGCGFTEQMMLWDLTSYLPDDILVKVDRAGMSVSLETRVPFLDHRVIECAWSLPLELKKREGEGKWLLRRVLDRYVPRRLIDRPKMGFGIPLEAWLRGPLRDWAESLLAPSRLHQEGFFAPALIREKWDEHQSGRRDWQYLLWDVLMFQAWLEQWEKPTAP